MVFSWACEGQPGDMQPTPLFSSQYTGSPLGTSAFCKVTQALPLKVGPIIEAGRIHADVVSRIHCRSSLTREVDTCSLNRS